MILIVGATGYIGRYLSLYLKEKGYSILAVGRNKDVRSFFANNEIEFQYFDFNDEASFKLLPASKIDCIINLAGVIAEHEVPVEKFFEVNTIGTYKLLEFSRKNSIKKFILSSTHKVYNDIVSYDKISVKDRLNFRGDHSPYIISKIAAENFVEYYNKDFGIEGVILRLTGIRGYGELLGHLKSDGKYKKSAFEIFVEKAINGEDIEVWGDVSIKRDHLYIKDLLSLFESIINTDGKAGIYNAASGIGYSLLEEAENIASVFQVNQKSKVFVNPNKQGLKKGYVYDIQETKEAFNWEPKYDNLKMLQDYKKEMEKKKFHHYHYIIESDRPATL
jgi:UDP-glucose 4-epimerase